MLKKIWDWLDGNKMVIGAMLLVLAGQEGDLLGSPAIEALVNWLGGILGGGGFLHKLIKGVNNTGK